jgi:hypothetical protein
MTITEIALPLRDKDSLTSKVLQIRIVKKAKSIVSLTPSLINIFHYRFLA